MAQTSTPEEPARPAPNPRRRSERARRAILAAAGELLGEVGYARLTMEAIASRARVGKQTIYRWWPTKAAVVFDVFTEMTGGAAGDPLPDTGDLDADLRTVLHAIVEEYADPLMDRINRVFIAEVQTDPELAENVMELLLRPNLRAFRDRLLSAREAGLIDAGTDPDLAVDLLLAPVQQRWLMRSGELTHAYVDALVDTVMRALRPRG
ncbi:TetR/AcrR family transcriptional regulator [Nocardiopsis flavescens]|uniref:DNA-binding transcriptional regulator, AcrR family n=1 Tax=Nocardiopsis flavescens TaxID=758803 RepID=A0A1M6QHC1_9ACTN|nr:TetR/AcrR family transcriptional regulator [Nocardiopsis flavescens]SHK19714.1 DNA-binding transcriptional regulator, AcrR family [Nocardiopsis flavescens]